MEKFLNSEEVLRGLNVVNNKVYTDLVDVNIKPQLVTIYDKLLPEIGYDKEIWYGDADVYVSIEKGYSEYGEDYDVLIIRNVVTCFDNNITVVVINTDNKYIPLCKCVSQVGKKNKYTFNDHRDWDVEGLDTLQEHNWKFGYEDLRDGSLVFERSSLWDKLNKEKGSDDFHKHYNDWNTYSYGCGFHTENLLFVEREVKYAYTMVCLEGDYVVEDKY